MFFLSFFHTGNIFYDIYSLRSFVRLLEAEQMGLIEKREEQGPPKTITNASATQMTRYEKRLDSVRTFHD